MWPIATRWLVLLAKTWLCWQKVLLLPHVAREANGVDHTSLLFISKERVEGHTWFFVNDFIENWLHFSIQMRVFFFFISVSFSSIVDFSETSKHSIVDLASTGGSGLPQEYPLGDPRVSLGESTKKNRKSEDAAMLHLNLTM